ncbi:amino acid ABC transporter permease [Catonella massiliensis]|uniref:Amino acid ABC transporter permease n=1 Tax=Catonella massiliensis TaxID=2799636 RepID=A0ABS1IXU4_9FIRM|nr:amino acid ABC transporter permease [Catonella massiliensis]MBK5896721.1 amino acid ABC transporter permease [Catonella massiliensis]
MGIFKNIVFLIEKYGNLFLIGTGYTLLLSLITVFFGTILGSVLAMLKNNRFQIIRSIVTAYIEIVRGTPILLQLYIFKFMLPAAFPSFKPSTFVCILVALILNSAAYVSEVIRSGIEAVDKGQTEAARSLGLSKRQTMLKIVLPQAVRYILPALGNEFIMMIKETSLASVFFVGDLMTQFQTISGATFLTMEPLIIIGIIYFVLTFSLSKGVAVLERRMKAGER